MVPHHCLKWPTSVCYLSYRWSYLHFILFKLLQTSVHLHQYQNSRWSSSGPEPCCYTVVHVVSLFKSYFLTLSFLVNASSCIVWCCLYNMSWCLLYFMKSRLNCFVETGYTNKWALPLHFVMLRTKYQLVLGFFGLVFVFHSLFYFETLCLVCLSGFTSCLCLAPRLHLSSCVSPVFIIPASLVHPCVSLCLVHVVCSCSQCVSFCSTSLAYFVLFSLEFFCGVLDFHFVSLPSSDCELIQLSIFFFAAWSVICICVLQT